MEDLLRNLLSRFTAKAFLEATDWAVPLALLCLLLIRYYRQWWILVLLFGPQIILRGLNSVYWHVLDQHRDLPYIRDLQAVALLVSAAVMAELWRRSKKMPE